MKNVAASVQTRLSNLARSTKQDVNALLDRYGAERLLYRVSRSRYAERFVLKGAQLFVVHTGARPVLYGYPLATVVAEKLESLVRLGIATSRMKDLYDLWYILRNFTVPEAELRLAVERTFARRKTVLDPASVVFTSTFWADEGKVRQWAAFRSRAAPDAPKLEVACRFVRQALRPQDPDRRTLHDS